jgi:hypothetical protein
MQPSAFDADQSAQITQLQQQQSLFTQALQAAIEGRWTGADSVEAYLYALNPNAEGSVNADTPVLHSEAENYVPKV